MKQDPLSHLHTRTATIIACFLIVIVAAELVFSIRQQSQTIDESTHIFAGYQYWKHRDFGANPEHPPLVKLLAAVPLLQLNLKPTGILPGPTKLTHTREADLELKILGPARGVWVQFPSPALVS